MAVPLSDLATDLLFEYEALPSDAIVHYIRRAATLMCQQGDLVRQTERITMRHPEATAKLHPEEGTEVWALLGGHVGPDRMWINQVDERLDIFDTEPHARTLTMFHCAGLWFKPPDEVGIKRPRFHQMDLWAECEVTYSTIPTKDACSVADTIYRDHYEILIMGVRYLIHSVSGKPWSNPQLALGWQQKFNSAIQSAKVFDTIGRVKGPMKLTNRRFL